MENSAYIALSRQGALRRELDVVANNIANMNTTAFKTETMMFVEHLVKSKGSGSFVPQKLAYVRDVAQFQNMSEGPIKKSVGCRHTRRGLFCRRYTGWPTLHSKRSF